jgi:hypothetical protein
MAQGIHRGRPKRIQLKSSAVEDFAIEEPAFRNLTKWGEQRASDHQSPFRLHGV